MTIRNRLVIAFLAILLIPSIAIGWLSYQSAASQVTMEIVHSAEQNVNIVNRQINDIINSSLADMDYLASRIKQTMIDGTSSPQIRTILDQYKALHPGFENVYYGTDEGMMFRSPEQVVEDYDPTIRSWYIKAMEYKGTAVINDPTVAAATGHVVVIPSKATDDGSGVVGANLDLVNLSEQVNQIKIGEGGYVFILDQDHKYLSHPTIEPGVENKENHTSHFYETDSGTLDYEFNGNDKKAVFVTNELTGWKIIGTIETSEISEASSGILITAIIVVAVSILLGLILMFSIIRSITAPLQTLIISTEKIASGDLTDEIPIRSKDELGQLSSSVNHMVHSLRELIGGVISSSHNVASASEQISATTEEVAGGSSAQAHAAQNMQELFGELSTAISSVAENASKAAELSMKSVEIAKDGGQIVTKSIESMNEVNTQITRLEGDSNKIGEIIDVIDDIAEQTNLLALNAAIEAARAGEQGRGFAVVADEVRKLAERSGEATKQITNIIKVMQENTHNSVIAVSNGVSQSEETGKAFERIVKMVDETGLKMDEIAAACEEQAAQSNEVMHSIESIASASQEAAAASEETAATSQSLAQLAENLNDTVSVFKVK